MEGELVMSLCRVTPPVRVFYSFFAPGFAPDSRSTSIALVQTDLLIVPIRISFMVSRIALDPYPH